MKKLFFILSTFLLGTSLYGQESSPDSLSSFSGYALYSIDSTAIPNVHVLNLSKGTGTVSGRDGSFELLVRDADTLKFSCIGLQDHYIHINTLLLRPELMVFLLTDTIMMDEVRISPMPLRRFFRYVFLDTRIPKVESEYWDEAGLNLGPMLKNDPGNIPATGINFTGPTQLLYNAFNKKARLERKLQRNRKKYSKYLVPEVADSLVWPRK